MNLMETALCDPHINNQREVCYPIEQRRKLRLRHIEFKVLWQVMMVKPGFEPGSGPPQGQCSLHVSDKNVSLTSKV